MLRITKKGRAQDGCTLKLEGRLVGPWSEELRQVCGPMLREGVAVQLDMAGVQFVDAAGLATLVALRAEGAAMAGCSPFLTEQLRSLTMPPGSRAS